MNHWRTKTWMILVSFFIENSPNRDINFLRYLQCANMPQWLPPLQNAESFLK